MANKNGENVGGVRPFIGARASDGNLTTSVQTGKSEWIWPLLYALSRMVIRLIAFAVVINEMPWAGRFLGPVIMSFGGLLTREKNYIAKSPPETKHKIVARLIVVLRRVIHWVFAREPRIPNQLRFMFPNERKQAEWQNVVIIFSVGVLLTFFAFMNWWPAWEWVLWSPRVAERLGPDGIPALPFDRDPMFGDLILIKDIRRREGFDVFNFTFFARDPYTSIYWVVGMDHIKRLFMVVGIPFCVAAPLLLLDWVFRTESVFTNFRSTVFGKADASGVELPGGARIQSMTGPAQQTIAFSTERPQLVETLQDGVMQFE